MRYGAYRLSESTTLTRAEARKRILLKLQSDFEQLDAYDRRFAVVEAVKELFDEWKKGNK